MGGFSNSVFSFLLGWLQTIASLIWSAFNNRDGSGTLTWIGGHWIPIFIILCVAGTAIDLLVYLLRWKPVQVWKSYFRRKKSNRNNPEQGWDSIPDFAADSEWAGDGRVPFFASNGMTEEQVSYYRPDEPAEEWENGAPMPETPPFTAPYDHSSEEYRAMFRRPSSQAEELLPEERYHESEAGSLTQRNLEKVVQPRRRRFRANGIFSGEDEDNIHYEAPQPVIDQREAYYSPVYPRNWQENGDR